MKIGALALLDCLGFKGIWKRADAPSVLKKLIAAEDNRDRRITYALMGMSLKEANLDVRVAFLSDTVVIGVQLNRDEEPTPEEKGLLAWTVAQIADQFAVEFRTGQVPLVLRGCIAVGQFVIHNNFILGPAVDEVASVLNLANGAFIWFTPEASPYLKAFESQARQSAPAAAQAFDPVETFIDHVQLRLGTEKAQELKGILKDPSNAAFLSTFSAMFKEFTESDFPPSIVYDYPMPIKGGDILRCDQINPYSNPIPEYMDTVTAQYKQAMTSTSIDVVVKWQNTENFLFEARRLQNSFSKRLDEKYERLHRPDMPCDKR